jgi:hypothetical protein
MRVSRQQKNEDEASAAVEAMAAKLGMTVVQPTRAQPNGPLCPKCGGAILLCRCVFTDDL